MKILKWDQGNAAVVINAPAYQNKMLNLINHQNTYQKISANPITCIKREVNNLLWRFVKVQKIPAPVYYLLKCAKRVTPKIYSLPKVHKVNVPFRPIVSFIGSLTNNLSRHLMNIVFPLLQCEYLVKNSVDFVDRIRDFTCDDQDCFVSFNVLSLFMSTPVSLAIDIISQLLCNDTSLHDCTRLTANDFVEALNLCVKSALKYFLPPGFWCTYGLLHLFVIENIFMKHLKRKAISTFRMPPTSWTRCDDDTLHHQKRQGNQISQTP